MSTRRDFLRMLALGTGAVLMGRGWYRQGRGLWTPPTTQEIVLEYWFRGANEPAWRHRIQVVKPMVLSDGRVKIGGTPLMDGVGFYTDIQLRARG